MRDQDKILDIFTRIPCSIDSSDPNIIKVRVKKGPDADTICYVFSENGALLDVQLVPAL